MLFKKTLRTKSQFLANVVKRVANSPSNMEVLEFKSVADLIEIVRKVEQVADAVAHQKHAGVPNSLGLLAGIFFEEAFKKGGIQATAKVLEYAKRSLEVTFEAITRVRLGDLESPGTNATN